MVDIHSRSQLLGLFVGKPDTNTVNIVAQRFLQSFLDHGVQAAQIPRLLQQSTGKSRRVARQAEGVIVGSGTAGG